MIQVLTALLFVFCGGAFAAPPAVTLRLVASGLTLPVEIAHAGDASGRLFVVEQGGAIKIIKDGAVLATPFLNITAQVLSGGERGLLGLAFHPQFRANGKFYVYYTRQADGTIVVSEYLRSAANADVADPATERQLFTVTHPLSNHNGGHMVFGPDGYLYIGIGDGGGGGDQNNNGQNLGVRLGKLLRIDVNTASGFAVPPSNPFVGQAGALPEIWAYGLRNPWKFNFDRATGDLLIADVGQDLWEEVDFQPAGDPGGRNYGWRITEGNHCFNPPSGCNLAGITLPIIEYGHNFSSGGFAIIGGYVYRGRKSRALRGFYLYGDNVSNHMWAAAAAENWTPSPLINGPGSISTFGEDEAGELYVASLNGGTVHAIDGPAPGVAARFDFSGDGRSDILWRNTSTGENYIYLMNGLTIASPGSINSVSDQAWQVQGIGDFDGDGKADILWRNGQELQTSREYIYLGDIPVAVIPDGASPSYIHVDHLNTPRLIANQQGQTVWRWDQDEPFGVNVPDGNPSGLGAFEFPMRFPGQYADRETGLRQNNFRDYDQSVGRYVESDPIGLDGGLNTYASVLSNPLSFIDIDGLEVRVFCRYVTGLERTKRKHCFVYVSCPKEGWERILSMFGSEPVPTTGHKSMAEPGLSKLIDNPSSSVNTNNVLVTPTKPCDACAYEKDVLNRFLEFPSGPVFYSPFGPNSNTFANYLITSPAYGASLPAGSITGAPGLNLPAWPK